MPRGIPSIPAAPRARPGRLPSARSAQAGGLQGGHLEKSRLRSGTTEGPSGGSCPCLECQASS